MDPCLHVFSRAWHRLHVFAASSDWFIVLFTSVVIGQSDYFDFTHSPNHNWAKSRRIPAGEKRKPAVGSSQSERTKNIIHWLILTIISRARVGYEGIDTCRVDYNDIISSKHESNDCLLKTSNSRSVKSC